MPAPAKESPAVSIVIIPTEDAASRLARVLAILLDGEAPTLEQAA